MIASRVPSLPLPAEVIGALSRTMRTCLALATVASVFLVQYTILLDAQDQAQSPALAPAQPPQTPLTPQNIQSIIQDFRNQQFFTASSVLGYLMSASLAPFLTHHITLLVPTDQAIATAIGTLPAQALRFPNIVLMHIVETDLTFGDFRLLPENTWLPTELQGTGVEITNNSPDNFTLNNAKIVRPDMCGSASQAFVTCQGIDRVLSSSVPRPTSSPNATAAAPPPRC